MGWIIALLVLLLIAVIPLGVQVHYDADGPIIRLAAGLLRITVFPMKKKQKKEKPKEPAPAKPKKAKQPPSDQPPEAKKGGSLMDFLPLVRTGLDFLNTFRKKLRIDRLQLKVILAGDDPCDLAILYGRAWAAMGNLLPALDRTFVIKNRDCEIECDFMASETLVFADAVITIRIGRLIAMAVVYGIRLIREYMEIKKKRKGGAVS